MFRMPKTSLSLRLFISLVAILPAATLPLAAQEGEAEPERIDPGEFYGFWQFEEPAGDTAIIIVKRGGRMSCFWSGVASHDIQKGTWSRKQGELVANWNTGYREIFRKLGQNAIERETYEPGEPLQGEPSMKVRGVRINPRVPGSLTVPGEGDEPPPRVSREGGRPAEPSEEDLPASALSLRNSLLGFWKIPQSTGFLGIGGSKEKHFYLQLSRNGEARVALRDWKEGNHLTGEWTIEEERAVIKWPNGSHDLLKITDGQTATLRYYKPNRSLEKRPNTTREAEKTTAGEAGRYFQAGNVKRLTVVDIRGTWRPIDPTGNAEHIDIEGWGNAYRYPAASGTGTDPGKWRLQNDRVVITWVDGSKDVLRMAQDSNMVQESYSSGEPVTGNPSRVIAVRQTDEKQF